MRYGSFCTYTDFVTSCLDTTAQVVVLVVTTKHRVEGTDGFQHIPADNHGSCRDDRCFIELGKFIAFIEVEGKRFRLSCTLQIIGVPALPVVGFCHRSDGCDTLIGVQALDAGIQPTVASLCVLIQENNVFAQAFSLNEGEVVGFGEAHGTGGFEYFRPECGQIQFVELTITLIIYNYHVL